MVERSIHIRKVVGPIPTGRTIESSLPTRGACAEEGNANYIMNKINELPPTESETEFYERLNAEWKESYEGILNRLKEKYSLTEDDFSSIRDSLHDDLYATFMEMGGSEGLRGKRILDLGSGATSSPDNVLHGVRRSFEPWYARALHELGSEPVAIDLGQFDNEEFESHSKDLLEKGALDFLPDKTFDAVHMSLFLQSPTLERELKRFGKFDDRRFEEVKQELKQQIERVLKDEGKKLGQASYALER